MRTLLDGVCDDLPHFVPPRTVPAPADTDADAPLWEDLDDKPMLLKRAGQIAIQFEHRSTLLITPTRALVNDLFERLTRPLSELGVVLGRKTADCDSSPQTCSPTAETRPPTDFDSHAHRICLVRDFDDHRRAERIA